jgi:Transposase IS66 family
VTEVACWAHFRRKIFDIHQAKPTALTTDILERIGALYAVEADVRGQPPDIRRRARQDRTALDNALRRLSPKSVMAKHVLSWSKGPSSMAPRAGSRLPVSSTMVGSRSTTISPNARCAVSPSVGATGCSPARASAVNALPPSAPSSRLAK